MWSKKFIYATKHRGGIATKFPKKKTNKVHVTPQKRTNKSHVPAKKPVRSLFMKITCPCSIVQAFLPQYLTEFIDNNRLLTELWLMSSFGGLKKTRFKTASYDCGQKHDCCFFCDFLWYGEDVIMVVLNPQRMNSYHKVL